MTPLTSDRQARLTALLDELRTFRTPERIVHCLEAVGVDPTVEADRARIDAAMAGAWAHDRTLLYLDRLRSLNEERMQLGAKIHQLKQHPHPTTEAEVEEAARARVLAPHLAGKQEIVVNFFSVSVQHIRSLLMIVADAVEYELPPADLAYLDEFRFLRNHFEHWYDRLPGKTNEAGLVTKTMSEDGYHVRGGLAIDEKDRFIVIEPKKPGPVTHVVEVNNDGFARVERIVQETDAKVKELAIERVRAHFLTHPDEEIPSPQHIRQELLISVGGYEAKPNPTTAPVETT